MAEHMLYTAEQVVNSSLAVLKHQSTLARIVNRDVERNFVPGRGARVTIKRPVMIDPARVYTKDMRDAEEEITFSELTQPYTSVELTDQVYQAVKLPDDFTTFELSSLEDQVVVPMVESVADHVNTIVANVFDTIDTGLTVADTAPKGAFIGQAPDGTITNYGVGGTALGVLRNSGDDLIAYGAGATAFDADRLTATTNGDVLKAIRAAALLLNLRGVPRVNRYLIVGSAWEAALTSQDILNKANESGSTELLRQAIIGNLYGFTIVADYTIDPYKAIAMNRDAVGLMTAVTAPPRGANFTATKTAGGFTMRYLHDYDPKTLRDRAVVDLFAGATILDRQRAVVLTGTEGFEEKAVETASSPSA